MKEKNDEESIFPATSEGLEQAIKWSKTMPHTFLPNKTLYDELYDDTQDGFTNIHKLNEAKIKLDNQK